MPIPKSVSLSDGVIVPRLALGTGRALVAQDTASVLAEALKRGIRHIVTAEVYENEEMIRDALKRWGGKRDKVFITTKFGRDDGIAAKDPRESLSRSLNKLDLEYVDLYLIHDPLWLRDLDLGEVWKTMEELKSEGLCRSIGVSNFSPEDMARISSEWTVIPSVNSVEVSPLVVRDAQYQAILRVARQHGIAIFPYRVLGPLFVKGRNENFLQFIRGIASRKAMTETQVLLAWAMQTCGGSVATGPAVSVAQTPEGCDELLGTFAFELTKEEIDDMAEAGKLASDWEETVV